MFKRQYLARLRQWKGSPGRKPLVLRGARQVGKTTLVNQFAGDFQQFITLNLERPADRSLIERHPDVYDLVRAVFFERELDLSSLSETLLFIDEIQESPQAVAMLRYFYEEYPALHVIAAGSLLETLFDRGVNFPVGRVEYMGLRPASFAEYLDATGENRALQAWHETPVPDYAHAKLLSLFHDYTLIGGMPEVVSTWAETRDLTRLKRVYDSLLAAYYDDVEKYATSSSQIQIMRHAIRSVFYEAGTRIKFQGFGASNYKSRDMGEALRTLEKTMLIKLVYPTVEVDAPWLPDLRKSPRLHALDTGLMNHVSGFQGDLIGTDDLNSHYQGKIAEHIVGQELLASSSGVLDTLHFWVREKSQSTAELDFLLPTAKGMVPVEVKSGSSGRLRSLHQYIEASQANAAVRLYAGQVSTEQQKTVSGQNYNLINLPYYLAGRLREYLEQT